MAEAELLKYFKHIDLFNKFPQDFQSKFASLATLRTFNPKDRILLQGQENSCLYILLVGQANVYVDGSLVATLEQMGDLIGEMSVISQSLCSATIIAETPVKALSVEFRHIVEVFGEDVKEMERVLYRAYSLALVNKLKITNQRAKQFEEMSDAHLRDIYKNQELTFKLLEKINNKNIVSLKAALEEISATDTDVVARAQYQLSEISGSLGHLTNRFSLERRARSLGRVLFVDSNRKDQALAKLALGGTGAALEIASSAEEAEEKLSKDGYDLIYVTTELLSLLEKLPKDIRKTKCVLMTSDPVSSFITEVKKLPIIPNIVSRSQKDRSFTIKNILTTLTKLTTGDMFGLDHYLAWSAEIQSAEITSSESRHHLNQTMQDYFQGVGIRSSRIDQVAAVTEEMLMNAIYDAPVDHSGRPLFNSLPRTEKVHLGPGQYGRLSYATDGMFMGVSVTDPFGSLEGRVILDYLESCYSGQAGTLNKNKGGAGRGLHMIIEMSDLVVFNIEPKVRTEIIALFNLDLKSSDNWSTSFHYFYK